MRFLERLFLIGGLICLGLYGFFTVQAWRQQDELEFELQQQLAAPSPPNILSPPTAPGPPAPTRLAEGALVGRLEIPRLNLSVMVMEGTADRTLRMGAGHIRGTSYPGITGNSGIAAHRDTFFRDIRNIKAQDLIRFTTPRGTLTYRVSWTRIVNPTDIDVLKPTSNETMTLVTCFPFYYIGPAPKRFVVQAARVESAKSVQSSTSSE